MRRLRYFLIILLLLVTGCAALPSVPPILTSPFPATPIGGGNPYPGGYCYTDAQFTAAFDQIYEAIIVNNDISTGENLMREIIIDARCHPKLDGGMVSFDYIYPEEQQVNKEYEIAAEITRDMAGVPTGCLSVEFITYSGIHAPAADPRVGQWQETVKVVCTKILTYNFDVKYWGSYIEDPQLRNEMISSSNGQVGVPAGVVVTLVNGTFRGNANYSYKWNERVTTYTAIINGITPFSIQIEDMSDRAINKIGNQYPYWTGGPGRSDEVFWPAPPYGPPTPRIGSAQFARLCMAEYQLRGYTYVPNNATTTHNNHHVKPIRWGGANAGNNCYRLTRFPHNDFSAFWRVGRFVTPTFR